MPTLQESIAANRDKIDTLLSPKKPKIHAQPRKKKKKEDKDDGRKNSEQFTELIKAAAENRAEEVQNLIEEGMVDVDAQSVEKEHYGNTALHFAAMAGNVDVIEALMKAAARLDLYADGATPLHSASYAGKADAISMLLQYGAPVDSPTVCPPEIRCEAGVTPLVLAAKAGHYDAVNVLIDAGADVLIRAVGKELDGGRGDAITHAEKGNHQHVIDALWAAIDRQGLDRDEL